MSEPSAARSSRTGSARAPGKLFSNDGPMARITTFFASLPVMMNPPIIALSPDSTRPRVAMLSGWDGGMALGAAVAVAVGLEEAVAVGATVAVGTTVDSGVAVGLGAMVAVGVAVGVGATVAVGVALGSGIAVGVGAAVAVG